MSLARSASGPGGLTINTGAANSSGMASAGGLFGSTPARPAGGLFGAAAPASATTPAPTGGLFGGAATTQPAATASSAGGLFGSAAPRPATGGLFGASTNTPQPAAAPASAGGLFGGGAAAARPGGLFGTSTATPAAQPAAATGGLFGSAPAAQPAAQPTGGLFGASTAQPAAQPAASGGLFGQPKPAATGGGLFGASQAAPAQPAAQISAVQINYDNLRPRSRFDDLAKPIQDEIALIDKGIQRVMKMRDEIGEFMPQHEKDVAQLSLDVKYIETKFRSVQDALNRDIQTVKGLQDITKKNITDAQLSFKATDNLKLPSHYHQAGLFAGPAPTETSSSGSSSTHANAQDLITYFNRICDDVEKYKTRLDEYRSEIERDMPGVENGLYEQIRAFRDSSAGGASAGGVHDQLGQILSALRETGSAIVVQAGRIADTRERLSRLQAGFLDNGLYGMNS